MKTNTNLIIAPVAFMMGVGIFSLILTLFVAQPTPTFGQEPEVEATRLSQDAAPGASEQTTPATTREVIQEPPSFQFKAKECDALTYMVRKSLTLFDNANDDIALSEEGIIYAETNIVQEIGPRLLGIGESVTIDSSLVEEYARLSQNLTPEEVAAWGLYTSNVDFEQTDIAPVNDVVTAVTPAAERQAQAAAEAQAEAEAQAAADEETNSADDTNSNSTSAGWWLVGGGAVAGLWYLLYRRNESDNS